jgi:hypothetical protein
MALAAVNIRIGTAFADGTYKPSTSGASIPSFASVTTNLATVSTDVATLVSDGASPTQGHVNTLNTDLGVLNTAYSALTAGITGDIVLIWNGSTVTHRNQMRAAILHLLRAIEGGYGGLAE